MSGLSGKRVLVTGASGLVAFPVAVELAKNNEVYAVARYTDPKQKQLIEASGARAIAFDVAEEDPELHLPESNGHSPDRQTAPAFRSHCATRLKIGAMLPGFSAPPT